MFKYQQFYLQQTNFLQNDSVKFIFIRLPKFKSEVKECLTYLCLPSWISRNCFFLSGKFSECSDAFPFRNYCSDAFSSNHEDLRNSLRFERSISFASDTNILIKSRVPSNTSRIQPHIKPKSRLRKYNQRPFEMSGRYNKYQFLYMEIRD